MQIEIHSRGIYFISQEHLSIWSWSYVAALVVVCVLTLAVVLGYIRRLRRRFRKDIWRRTSAQILDNEDVIGTGPGRSRNGITVYPDYKIVYYAEGKRYEKSMNGEHMIGCIDTIDIEYLKDKPEVFRKALISDEISW